MRLLYVEDQPDFVNKIKAELEKKMSVVVYDGAGLDTSPHSKGDSPIETQIANMIKSMEKSDGQFDAVLLDTDLSSFQNGISQSAFRSACSLIGLPVLRYSKRGLTQASERLKYLATIAREGSQAILVPDNILQDGLADWVLDVAQSFKNIRAQIEIQAKDNRVVSPAQLLAIMLDIPDIDIDLMGYSGANFFFFGDLIESPLDDKSNIKTRNYATQLGYWLANYVLMFPGPILNKGAAAAHLAITKGDIEKPEVELILREAEYRGPFASKGQYYIRQLFDQMLASSEATSFAELLNSKKIQLEESSAKNNHKLWYYCVVSDEPVLDEDARGPFDWIPRGADICRVKKDLYDKFGPWLNV